MTRLRNNFSSARTRRAGLCLALALLTGACAAMSRPPETGRPRAGELPYPVLLGASAERRDKALAVWAAVAGEQGIERAPAPELQPVTATLRALPSAANASTQLLRLPQVGGADGKVQTEEELREALRRFIATTSSLLGVAPQDLSLVERTDTPEGARRALYRQSPFPYPLRAGYGMVEIRFTPDRRVNALTSTAIPDAERLRRALERVRPVLTAKDAAARLAGRAVTYPDPAGQVQTFNVASADAAEVREMVVYPLASADAPDTLALHLAWEIQVAGTGARPLLVYLDAVTGDVLATSSVPATVNSSSR